MSILTLFIFCHQSVNRIKRIPHALDFLLKGFMFKNNELEDIMKSITYVLAVLFLVTSGYVFAATETTIDSKNEHGGITNDL